ncbi:MAG: VOC family protein [Acidimicrobiia bacterium]
MIENRSAPPGPIVPSLVYDDVAAAVEWLCEVFGFSERLRWGPPDDFTAQLDVGGGSIFVRGPRTGHGTAERLTFRAPRPDELSHTLMVQVEDVDRHHDHAMGCGAEILLPVETYGFGERQYSARDVGRHAWTFTQSVADVDPQEWIPHTLGDGSGS